MVDQVCAVKTSGAALVLAPLVLAATPTVHGHCSTNGALTRLQTGHCQPISRPVGSSSVDRTGHRHWRKYGMAFVGAEVQ